MLTRSRGGVSELPTPRKSNMDPVSRVSSCLSRVSHTGVAGVVTVSRVSGASLFGLMTAYINLFIAIMPRYPGGKLQYSNLPAEQCGMLVIKPLIYVITWLNSEVPHVRP